MKRRWWKQESKSDTLRFHSFIVSTVYPREKRHRQSEQHTFHRRVWRWISWFVLTLLSLSDVAVLSHTVDSSGCVLFSLQTGVCRDVCLRTGDLQMSAKQTSVCRSVAVIKDQDVKRSFSLFHTNLLVVYQTYLDCFYAKVLMLNVSLYVLCNMFV